MLVNKLLIIFCLCFILYGFDCSKWYDETEYVNQLNKIGWEGSDRDSVLVLFSSISECGPCNNEIEYWDKIASDKNDQLAIVLVISEKYNKNYKSYLSENNFQLSTLLDSENIFRQKELIPFIPFKLLITQKGVKKIGELGYSKYPY
jgi:hypothetical protein